MKREPPTALLERYQLRAKKSWGQCFLQDGNVVERIVQQVDPAAEDLVLEIGAGLGTLTVALAERGCRVVAIERDRDLAQVLRAELDPARVTVEEDNALTHQLCQHGSSLRVVGNLPYNISSQLLFRLLEQRSCLRDATLMLQKELADRLVAQPGSRVYGIPSVLCGQLAELRRCFVVKASCFVPRPRVDSAVIQLRFREQPLHPCDLQCFEKVVKTAFGKRRKNLRNALSSLWPLAEVERALAAAEIPASTRAEALSVRHFARLSDALAGSDELPG